MNRLTNRDPKDGLAYTVIPLNTSCVFDDINQQFHACYTGFIADRLASYEDTELEPEEILQNEELFKAYMHVYGGRHPHEIVKALELLDLEEQSRLIKMPCKVEDAVYAIDVKGNIHECKVYNITTNVYAKENENSPHWVGFEIKSDIFGKTVFPTREEAEKALEVMNEN